VAAFDQSWWDDRTLRYGKVAEGEPTGGDDHATWTRWRLVDELLQRFYVDIGLEPLFGLMGVELYQVGLASPTCRRHARYFGRLCGAGVHPEHEDFLDVGVPLAPANLADRDLHEDSWPDWPTYRRDAIRTLGLVNAGVPGHEGCFHRRGKALTPLMYRIALLLRTDGGHGISPYREIITVTGHGEQVLDTSQIRPIIEVCGGTIPPGPPRYFAVSHELYDWVALRADGWVATTHGPVDAAALWRSGADPVEIAGAIDQMCTRDR
jgi:hypothetical protein